MTAIALFGIWILLAILVGKIAEKKGRQFLPWFAYGILLFIVAIIHALLIKPDQMGIDRALIANGGRKCPMCAEVIRSDAKVCRFCGREVPTLALSLPDDNEQAAFFAYMMKPVYVILAVAGVVVMLILAEGLVG